MTNDTNVRTLPGSGVAAQLEAARRELYELKNPERTCYGCGHTSRSAVWKGLCRDCVQYSRGRR
jgi:hypothetical protein